MHHRAPLHDRGCEPAGFHWLDADDAERSATTTASASRPPGLWRELINTDAAEFGGSGQGNFGGIEAAPVGAHHRDLSLNATIPPLGAVLFKR